MSTNIASSPATPTICVFYLLRHGNSGVHFASFVRSLQKNRTATAYTPVVIQKGFPAGVRHRFIESWIAEDGTPARCIDISDDGFDLLAYRKAAAQVEADYCLFFNSYSRILGAHWLDHYCNALRQLGENSLIGATGSWQRPTETGPFPNIHIRSNAFMISRKLFLTFDAPLDSKDDSYQFEHGPQSMTKRVLAQGGAIAIIDRNGRVLLPDQWPESNVFWSGNQELLLVSDNQTQHFQLLNPRKKLLYSTFAWGDGRSHAVPHSRSRRFLDRWRRTLERVYSYASLMR